MVPNTLGFPTNGTDGLISRTDLFPRAKEASIGFLRTETDPDPFDIHIPDIPEDVPFNQGIKCLGCNQSFPAASLPIQPSKVETADQQEEDGTMSPLQISSIAKAILTADAISTSKAETVPSAASEHEAGPKSLIRIKSNQKTHSSPREEQITHEDSIITQSSHPTRKLVGCVEYYRHCIMQCPKYQQVAQVRSCLRCLKVFLNGDDFNDHKTNCASGEEEEEEPFTSGQGIKCVHCGRFGISHDDLEAHYGNNHPGIPLYPCLTCDKVYQRKRCLARHEVQWHKLVTCGSLREEDFDQPQGLRRSWREDSNAIVLDSNTTSRTSEPVKKARPKSVGQSMLTSTPLKQCKKSCLKSKRKKSQSEEGTDWLSPIVSLSPMKEGYFLQGKGVKNESGQSSRYRNPSGQSINRSRNPSSQSSRYRNPSGQSVNLRARNPSSQVTPLKNCQGCFGLSRNPSSSAFSDCSFNQGDFPCDICPIRFVKSVHLKHHKSSVHEFKKISCIKCSKTFKSINSYMNHHHFLDDQRIFYLGFRSSSSGLGGCSQLGSNYEDYFTKNNNCTICGKWCKSKNQSDHFLSVHVGTLFRCPYCPLSFRSVPSIESHLQKSHDCKNTISNPTPYFIFFKDTNL